MDADLDTLLTALYCFTDHVLIARRQPGRPKRLTDAELVCLAVAQVLLNRPSEAGWLRYARKHLDGMFPYLPQQPGWNKRLRAAGPLIARSLLRATAAGRGPIHLDATFLDDDLGHPGRGDHSCGRVGRCNRAGQPCEQQVNAGAPR